MKRNIQIIGMVSWMLLSSIFAFAETDRELLVKRWKVMKHQKSSRSVLITADDFIQLSGDGIYQHARNHFYSKGTWALNVDELIINNNGEHKWKITSVTSNTMMLSRGNDEVMELEAVAMPAQVEKTASANLRYLCMGKWRPNEQHKNTSSTKFNINDVMDFHPDGTYEQVLNGIYTKGVWSFNNSEETEILLNNEAWKIENITALFFKISKVTDNTEFVIFAKTR